MQDKTPEEIIDLVAGKRFVSRYTHSEVVSCVREYARQEAEKPINLLKELQDKVKITGELGMKVYYLIAHYEQLKTQSDE